MAGFFLRSRAMEALWSNWKSWRDVSVPAFNSVPAFKWGELIDLGLSRVLP
jgi:hypothetical protein